MPSVANDMTSYPLGKERRSMPHGYRKRGGLGPRIVSRRCSIAGQFNQPRSTSLVSEVNLGVCNSLEFWREDTPFRHAIIAIPHHAKMCLVRAEMRIARTTFLGV